MDNLDDDLTCRTDDCPNSTDDGEGYDGFCGCCAAPLDAAGHWQ